ncbi:hypothetical protein TNCT_443611 [Trichonephila clavata]|uniref:Uncharacterized protein n=1 Tax=Trichonephila clavata TaxID=2740835 RepID=A0A8X6M5L8_TRICU|nr:hypothetical protein TNCT_443611 [Trichonephila clavata]
METEINESKARWRAALKAVFYTEPIAVEVNNCIDDDETEAETKNNFCRHEIETEGPANHEDQIETDEPANNDDQIETDEPVNNEDQIETDEPANNEDQIETDEPSNKNHNECENIKRKECDSSGCKLLNLLKDALLDESKKSGHTNSVDDDSVVPYDHSQTSIDWENDDLDNAENFYLLGESATGNSSKGPEKIEFRTIFDDFPEFKKEVEEMEREYYELQRRRRLARIKRRRPKRQLTAEEKEILDILKAARTFKKAEKPHYNIFDGAGVDCFQDRKKNESVPAIRAVYEEEYSDNFPCNEDLAQRQADRYLEGLCRVEEYSDKLEDLPPRRDDRYFEKLWGIEEGW